MFISVIPSVACVYWFHTLHSWEMSCEFNGAELSSYSHKNLDGVHVQILLSVILAYPTALFLGGSHIFYGRPQRISYTLLCQIYFPVYR